MGDHLVVTNPAIAEIIALLKDLSRLVDEIPPLKQPMRYGNKAFVTWLNTALPLMIQRQSSSILTHAQLPPDTLAAAAEELSGYLIESFGNNIRIDYGTGHETNFVVWLFCLYRINVMTVDDFAALVLLVFNEYLLLLRKVQKTYGLEPAGSHGVWGLDDYQFLPFLFGSSQLIGNNLGISPKSIHNAAILTQHSEGYLYLASIAFINSVKTGPFREHSPILNDISNLPNWEKANTGLFKMYLGEVFHKLPVIQHLKFGSIFPFPG